MRPRFEADGDTWEAMLEERESHPGTRAIVFACVSRNQRPYRVVEVPAARFGSERMFDELSGEEWLELFDRADPMDYAHEAKADPDHPGWKPTPRPERQNDVGTA